MYMSRGIDFKQKEVINVNDGKILGFTIDVQADFEKGEIHSIVVAKTGKVFANAASKSNLTIDWKDIIKIGEDVILVDI